MSKKVVVVGSGNAALSAGIAALEKGAEVVVYEKADKKMAGGNTKYTAGAMRFSYENGDQLIDLLKYPAQFSSHVIYVPHGVNPLEQLFKVPLVFEPSFEYLVFTKS